jgi:hypothetical protein
VPTELADEAGHEALPAVEPLESEASAASVGSSPTSMPSSSVEKNSSGDAVVVAMIGFLSLGVFS